MAIFFNSVHDDAAVAQFLGLMGIAGALLLLVADYVLYMPSNSADNSSDFYFRRIDPSCGTRGLGDSSMAAISANRLLVGGMLAAPATVLYTIGFLQFWVARANDSEMGAALAFGATLGHSGMMIAGGLYHALFSYTGGADHTVDTAMHSALLVSSEPWCAFPLGRIHREGDAT